MLSAGRTWFALAVNSFSFPFITRAALLLLLRSFLTHFTSASLKSIYSKIVIRITMALLIFLLCVNFIFQLYNSAGECYTRCPVPGTRFHESPMRPKFHILERWISLFSFILFFFGYGLIFSLNEPAGFPPSPVAPMGASVENEGKKKQNP